MSTLSPGLIDANNVLVNSLYVEKEANKDWKGYRLLGIDGSRLNLPNSLEIASYFNTQENNYGSVPMALLTCVHDVLHNVTVLAVLGSCKESELVQAKQLIGNLNDSKDLLILDRGYGALWFMNIILGKRKDFVIRINRVFYPSLNNEPDGSIIHEYSTLPRNAAARFEAQNEEFNPMKLRFIVLTLPNGEREFLATSLVDQDLYPDNIFASLYALRWGVETYYHHLKVHMDIENFSGKSTESVFQDVFAGIFVENLRVALEIDANKVLDEKKANKSLQYRYKVNSNISFGILRDEIIELTLNEKDLCRFYKKMKELFVVSKIPVIKNRHIERGAAHMGKRRKFFMSGPKTT